MASNNPSFNHTIEKPKTRVEINREQISADIEKYLKSGGTIEVLESPEYSAVSHRQAGWMKGTGQL